MNEISGEIISRLPILIKGAGVTISVAIIALIISILLGLIFALFNLSKSKPLNIIGTMYTTIVRGIPELVLILLVFYGGQQLINDFLFAAYEKGWVKTDYIDISPFIAGSITIGIIYGAYMAETFRGAIMAVPAGQIESAKSIGLSQKRIFLKVIFPQMARHALPGVGNNWQVMLKATALVSLISLQDLVKITSDAAKSTGLQFSFYLLAAAVFLFFTAISTFIFSKLEKRYGLGFN